MQMRAALRLLRFRQFVWENKIIFVLLLHLECASFAALGFHVCIICFKFKEM
jgi:hypothetical protein